MYESFKGLKGYKKNEGRQWEKKATKVLHQQNITNKDKVVGVVENEFCQYISVRDTWGNELTAR